MKEKKAKEKTQAKARFQTLYQNTIIQALMQQFSYQNPMQVPRIRKITVNMGVGEAATDKKFITSAVDDMTKITGQKPVINLSRKSIAAFKVREGWPVGCKVTLRGKRMYEFLDRLVTIVIPRIRDFRGLSAKSFDGRGNYTLGIREQIVFPEIDYDKIDEIRGMDITITTDAPNDTEAKALLLAFGLPLKQEKN